MGKKNILKIEIQKNVHILRTRSKGRCTCGAECEKLLCHSITKTLGAIVLFYTFSISLTFFNQKFIQVRKLRIDNLLTFLWPMLCIRPAVCIRNEILCIRPAVCIRNEILCIRPAVCRHTEAMHTAGLIPNTNPNPAVRKLQFTAVLYGYRA